MRRILNRKRVIKAFAVNLVLVCLISIMLAPMAYAAETVDVTLTVQQVFTTDGLSSPPGDTFTYRLTPITTNAPMPLNNDSEYYVFTISGSGEVQIGLSFRASGIYSYELRCVSDERTDYTIDRRVYTIEVHVIDNSEVLLIYLNGENKVADLLFRHSYRTPNVPPVTPNPPPGTPWIPPVTINPTPVTPSPPPDIPNPSPSVPAPPSDIPNTSPGDPTPPPGKPDLPSDKPSLPPDAPASSSGGRGGYAPKTGDDSNPALWITLIAVSGVLLILLFWTALRLMWKRRWRS